MWDKDKHPKSIGHQPSVSAAPPAPEENDRDEAVDRIAELNKELGHLYNMKELMYIDIIQTEPTKLTVLLKNSNSNATCICDSGKKVKKCCGPIIRRLYRLFG